MRWVEFTIVMMSQTEDGRLKVAKGPRIVNAEKVQFVDPGVVPSEVMGPGDTPIGKPAAILSFPGGEILVDHTVSEVLYKLTWEGIDIEGPEGLDENEFQVTKTVKRPVPKIEPETESNIIQ
jgi:hypothetical protein